jgi:hypothetical protein
MEQQATTRPARSRKPYIPTVSRAEYKPLVRRLGSHGLFRVQSASDPSKFYIVDTVDNSCTCPNGQAGKGQCWHLKAACGIVFFPAQKVEAAPAKPVYTGPTGMAALDDVFGPLNLPA